MQAPFPYRCPFCNQNATIGDADFSKSDFDFFNNNRHGRQLFRLIAITCPNPDCHEFSIRVHRYKTAYMGSSTQLIGPEATWQLIPASSAKLFPDYIPRAIRSDYEEACAIRDLSPKASATLSRRCLQGMIRDFWSISRHRLVDEIAELEEKVDPGTWSAIDALRRLGNIGAHMEKDISVMVDVDPDEAALLICLIETLLHEWYIVRHDREERLQRLAQAALGKVQERSVPEPVSGIATADQ